MPKTASKSSKKEVKTTKPSAKVAAKAKAKSAPAKKESKVAKKAAPKKIEKAPTKGAVSSKGAASKLPLKKAGAAKASVKSSDKADKKSEVKKADLSKVDSKKADAKKADAKKTEAKRPDSKKIESTKKVADSAIDKKDAKKLAKSSGKKEVPPKVEATDKKSAVDASLKSAKAGGKKKTPATKKEEFALEDDLVGENDDFSTDELSEYQAELESAEEEVDEKEVVIEEPAQGAFTTTMKEGGDDIILTDAEGRRYCRVKDCDQIGTVDAYCRYHYLLLWKKIQVRKKILTDGKLERYIEELTSRYPDKFLEVIRRDLRTEKDFVSAIQEMEIDESGGDNDFEDESSNFIDEVRGATPESLTDDDDY